MLPLVTISRKTKTGWIAKQTDNLDINNANEAQAVAFTVLRLLLVYL